VQCSFRGGFLFHVVHVCFARRFTVTLYLGFIFITLLCTELFPSNLAVFRRGCVKEQINNICSLFSYFYNALSNTILVITHHEMEPTNRKELNETKRNETTPFYFVHTIF
jgi:hypothetical protein